MSAMPGICECGCGLPTRIATNTNTKKGYIAGMPRRFIQGHQNRAEHNSNWNGGQTNTDGYTRKRVSRDEYRGEHVILAEKALGHQLPARAVVHHVNGVRSDNRGSNLVICEDQTYHMLLHRRARAFKATGNASAVQCLFCKQWGSENDDGMYCVHLRNGEFRSYHRSCRPKQRQKNGLSCRATQAE